MVTKKFSYEAPELEEAKYGIFLAVTAIGMMTSAARMVRTVNNHPRKKRAWY